MKALYSGAVPGPPEWRTYPLDDEPDGADPPREQSPYPPADRFPVYDRATEKRRVRRRVGLLLGSAAAVLVGVGAGVWGVVAVATHDDGDTSTTHGVIEADVSGSTTSTTTTTISGGVDLFTEAGMTDLVAAVRAETGSTEALEVTMFPRWAVVTVPAAGGRARVLKWDGTLTAVGPSSSPREPFDLRELEGSVLARLCGDDTTTCTVLAGRPLAPGESWLTITNGEQGAVQRTDLAGNPALRGPG